MYEPDFVRQRGLVNDVKWGDVKNSYWFILLTIFLLPAAALGQQLQTGVIFLQPMKYTVAEQNDILDQMQANGVRLIRTAILPERAYIDFAKRAYAKNIQIDALIVPQVPRGIGPTPAAEGFNSNWSSLSYADPTLSRQFMQKLFQQLDANGIVLAGVELGNEINWSDVNAGFPQSIQGKILQFSDLQTDPQGQQFAANFSQYLKILAILKEVRDSSTLNRQTPIISAGLVSINTGDADTNFFENHGYSVTISATIQYLRAGGLDNLVDFYGIHYYPKDATPAARKRHLDVSAVSVCQPAGATSGKPCWITEWGVDNPQQTCPTDDTARAAIVTETMNNFRELASAGRLADVFYYAWNSPPGSQRIDPPSIYRCGQLTEAGRLALGAP
jgi:hypothetical protein